MSWPPRLESYFRGWLLVCEPGNRSCGTERWMGYTVHHQWEEAVSAFTSIEVEYLRSQRLARLATVGADGRP
jgi:hypothetical protein